MDELRSIEDLAAAVNAWCGEHGIAPASGQAGEEVTERSIRYYRTLGLVDAPLAGPGAGFGEKQQLQLMALRLLQAEGLPLRKIRELLYGRSLEELRELLARGLSASQTARELRGNPGQLQDELWRAIPLNAEFTLLSRQGRSLSPGQRARLLEILTEST